MIKIGRYKYEEVNCYHCNIEMVQRMDTYKRQISKYGHNCCAHCFGKEQSFKDARTRVMLENNPFKGKQHSEETKIKLSEMKKGQTPWNKGLTKENHDGIKKGGEKLSISRKEKYLKENNPNWKGGISETRIYNPIEKFKPWMKFRQTILERDGYKCKKCESNKRLEVHHMTSRTFYPELEFSKLNCITLCRKCHLAFHKAHGRKNFTYDNSIKFILKIINI